MVIGGRDNAANFDVEVIDLSGNMMTCTKPANTPESASLGMTGTYFKGYPTVCGGFASNVTACNQYDFQVS